MTKPLNRCRVPGHPRMKCEEVDGHPVSVWDAGPKTNDRYDVVDLGGIVRGFYGEERVMYYGMNGVPFSPNCGVARTGEVELSKVCYRGRGGVFDKRIAFAQLPPDCQKAARAWLKA